MKALLVNGSPRGEKATSQLLANLLADGLRERGAEAEQAWALGALRNDEDTGALLRAWDDADVVVVSFPLYVDSLPAPLTCVLELVAARRASRGDTRSQRLAAVVQCGFPEAVHTDTAVTICRLFARDAGMTWAGALAFGEGGMLGGGLDSIPPRAAARVRSAAAATAESLAAGGLVPEDAAAALREPMLPPWAYITVANAGWHMQKRQNKADRQLGFRAYATRA